MPKKSVGKRKIKQVVKSQQPPVAPEQAYIQDLFEQFRAGNIEDMSLTEQKLCEKLSEHETKVSQLSQELTKVENEIQSFQRRHQQLQLSLSQQTASAQTLVDMLKTLWEAGQEKD